MIHQLFTRTTFFEGIAKPLGRKSITTTATAHTTTDAVYPCVVDTRPVELDVAVAA